MGSHDDSTFLYTKPLSAVGLWFALEDCTAENGCLSFVKGSHKANPIVKRLVRVDGGKGGTRIEKVEGVEPGRDWEAEDVEWTVAPVDKGGESGAFFLERRRGDSHRLTSASQTLC